MTDLPVTKAPDDELLELLRTKCGGCEGICEEAADEIERLRSKIAAAETTNGYHVLKEMSAKLYAAEAQLQAMRKALEEIAEGKGRYSQDRYEHACNTIEDMKELARESLRSLTEGAGK